MFPGGGRFNSSSLSLHFPSSPTSWDLSSLMTLTRGDGQNLSLISVGGRAAAWPEAVRGNSGFAANGTILIPPDEQVRAVGTSQTRAPRLRPGSVQPRGSWGSGAFSLCREGGALVPFWLCQAEGGVWGGRCVSRGCEPDPWRSGHPSFWAPRGNGVRELQSCLLAQPFPCPAPCPSVSCSCGVGCVGGKAVPV